jgi:threonine dehydrogenase-like Zn-dependent dehydrogenase
MCSAGDVRVEEREEPKITEPTDGIIRLTATRICGSDLWPSGGIKAMDERRAAKCC